MSNRYQLMFESSLNLQQKEVFFDYTLLDDLDAFIVYSLLVYLQIYKGNVASSVFGIDFERLMPTSALGSNACVRLFEVGVLIPVGVHNEVDDSRILTMRAAENGISDVMWRLAVDTTRLSREELLIWLESRLMALRQESLQKIWFMVAQAECERYLMEMCKKYNFRIEPILSERTAESISYCLMRLSVPQVWNILWCSMRDIAALLQTGEFTRPHLFNILPIHIKKELDRRLANFKRVKPWNRQHRHVEAVATTALFDKVLINFPSAFDSVFGQQLLDSQVHD